jgi:ribosomal protein S18 acetylase RimI-like enzyme
MSDFVPGTEIQKPVVELVGQDGNAYLIMGKVQKALRRAGVPKKVIDEYLRDSKSGDYDHLLAVACEYAEVE